MGKKKLTLEELRDKQHDIDQNILRVRKIMETHATERERIYSQENKRRLTPQALAEDEAKLRRKTEMSLGTANASIAQAIRETEEHRDSWSYEHSLRTSRFAPEVSGTPGTPEAQQRALNYEMLEAFRRGNSEHRAARYSVEDLIIETERAALEGDTASAAVYRQESRNRKLAGLEKVSFDSAFKKLKLPEIDEAQGIFGELENLSAEADSLFTLWKEPNNEMAKSAESLGRFNRRKKAEALVAKVEAEGKRQAQTEPEQSSAA